MTAWVVEIDLALRGTPEAVEKYGADLQAHLERTCPEYRPQIHCAESADGPNDVRCKAGFTVRAPSKGVAVNKATYWLRRAVHSERTLPWTPDLMGETTARHAA